MSEDARVTASLAVAPVGDRPGAVQALAAPLRRVLDGHQRLRSVALYPALLAASVAVAGAAAALLAAPALAALPDATLPDFTVLWVCVAGAVGVLFAYAAAGLTAGRGPGFAAARHAIDAAAFTEVLAILLAHDAPAPAAVRGAAAWTRGASRRSAEAFAHSLEAGSATGPAQLLSPFEARLLGAAATAGTLGETADAIAEQRRIRLDRVLPSMILVIQAVALAVSGLALLAVAVAFTWEYAHVFG